MTQPAPSIESPLGWRIATVSMLLMATIGFCMLVITVSTNMILQTIVDDDKRGRVMSIYTASFLGIVPFGALVAGVFADRIGATTTVMIGGLLCVCVALTIARKLPVIRAHIRPIYAKLGLTVE